jgi:hypothetical protein
MARIVPFQRDRHAEVRLLLPWYLTRRLDADEHARIEAHLRDCADCQAELRQERALDLAVGALQLDVEHGWGEMRRRLERPPSWRTRLAEALQAALTPRRLAWAAGAQLAIVLVGATVLVATNQRPAEYHALGASQVAPAGNVLVIFRPETPESTLRAILRSSDARLVDGPTSAGAYVVAVRPPTRAATLERLRGRHEVMLAEPIDADAAP